MEDVKIFENEEEENSTNDDGGEIINGEIIDNKWFLSAIRGDLDYLKDNAESNAGKVDDNNATALMYSADAGNTECIKILINYKEEIRKKDKDGNTALILATKKGYADIVKILVKYEASIENNNGKTALDFAIENNDKICIDILKDAESKDEKNKENVKDKLEKENKKLKSNLKKVEKANDDMSKIVEEEKERYEANGFN